MTERDDRIARQADAAQDAVMGLLTDDGLATGNHRLSALVGSKTPVDRIPRFSRWSRTSQSSQRYPVGLVVPDGAGKQTPASAYSQIGIGSILQPFA